MLRLLAALVLAIMLVPLLSSASAQDATPTVNTDDSLEGNLYALGILIQARAATTYQRDFDASGDGPRSFDFLLMEFDDDASASIAMKMTLEYFASFDLEDESDDQKNHLDYVHITNVGDEQYAAHSNDGSELFRTDYGYVAVRFGSIVFYAQTHGNSFNPLTPLVEFSVSVADCLGQRSPESDDDLALCLPGFDLMPAFFDEFIFALSPSTDPVPTVIKQDDPNRFEATGNISSSVSILALPGTYTVTFACQGTGESYAWIGYPYDLLGYIETTGTELDLSFSGAVVTVTIGIRCNGEWSIIGTRSPNRMPGYFADTSSEKSRFAGDASSEKALACLRPLFQSIENLEERRWSDYSWSSFREIQAQKILIASNQKVNSLRICMR